MSKFASLQAHGTRTRQGCWGASRRLALSVVTGVGLSDSSIFAVSVDVSNFACFSGFTDILLVVIYSSCYYVIWYWFRNTFCLVFLIYVYFLLWIYFYDLLETQLQQYSSTIKKIIKILVINTGDSCIITSSFEHIKIFLFYKIIYFIFRRPPLTFVPVSKAYWLCKSIYYIYIIFIFFT